jgi:hypothetical protein
MSDASVKCPSCGGQIGLKEKQCPHCGRWLVVRGISFYAFWASLSLIVVALLGYMFHAGFVMLNRML